MANRWRKTETVTDFIFLGSRITAHCDCNYEIKTLAPWKKSYNKRVLTNLFAGKKDTET